MTHPARGRRSGTSSHFTLSWLVALAALAELGRDEWVGSRRFHELYNRKARQFGFDQISAQVVTALLETLRSRGLIERSPSQGAGRQRMARATAEGMQRLEQVRLMLE